MAKSPKRKALDPLATAADRSARDAVTATRKVTPYDVVAHRAYELYLARGREDGHDVDDWLRAEGEVRSLTEV
jgi:Protein of unknown function (DUF2934)